MLSEWVHDFTSSWTFPPSIDTTLAVILLLIVIRFLKIFEENDYPQLILNVESSEVKNGIQLRKVFENCPILHECYNPPNIWGRNGNF